MRIRRGRGRLRWRHGLRIGLRWRILPYGWHDSKMFGVVYICSMLEQAKSNQLVFEHSNFPSIPKNLFNLADPTPQLQSATMTPQ